MQHQKLQIIILSIILLITGGLIKFYFDLQGIESSNNQFYLTIAQKNEAIQSAKNGDNSAALKLYMYYSLIEYNEKEIFYWAKLAAERGDSTAQHNLAVFYEDNLHDKQKASYWYRKAASNGNINSQHALNRLGNPTINN